MPSIAIPVSLRGQLLNSVRAVAFSPSALFALNEPGVWYDPSDVANLAWRRNLLVNSENFNTTTWTTRLADATLTQGITDPLGGNSAATLTSTGALGRTSFSPGFTLASGTQVATSVWLRRRTGTGTVSIYDSGVSQSAATTVTLTSDWQRFSVAKTISYTGTQTPGIVLGTNGDAVDMWGFQFELGSVATDYQRISDVNTEVIERFPSATLYQDTAGTTPVTTPGQTVALALDKSKGLVLGSELAVNGDFESSTGWTVAAGVVISGGVATFTNATSSSALFRSASVSVGKTYQVTVVVSSYTSGSLNARLFGGLAVGASITAAGTYTFRDVVTSANFNIGFVASGATAVIDNISVKELPGFHATQATLASRPTYGIVPLGGRRNLLTRTEEFNDAVWVKANSSITANAVSAPDGTTTADKLVENTANSTHTASQAFTTSASTSYTFTVYAKAETRGHLDLAALTGFTTNPIVRFTLSGSGTSSVRQGNPTPSHSIQSVGDGWYRCQINVTTVAGGSSSFQVALALDASSSNFYTGDGTSGLFLWGAQLETGSSATAYQRVGSAFDVTEAGVASLSYLSFDGVDDSLVTPTITPGIDKAQVFAGVRKLSDAAVGTVAELSANSGSNSGSFGVFAPGSISAAIDDFGATLNGSAFTGGRFNGYDAPTTRVISSLFDISQATAATEITFRANGSTVPSDGIGSLAANAGTGNFLAYPLYIGRRGGSTVPFNGQLYSLIVRFGTNLDAGTITSTETWVNGKTGAYA